jgi:hypothetical protein
MHWSALLSGPLDAAALRAACARMLTRHQCLRACFRPNRANQTVQVVRREAPLAWRQIDLSGYPESQRAERLERLTKAVRSDRWLAKQDREAAENAWRDSLAGLPAMALH